MAILSVSQFLARFDRKYVTDLVTREGDSEPEVTAQIEARVGLALEDAEAEIEGYRARIAPARWPSEATRRTHVTKVATYLLTLDRPGSEYEQIRNAYTDTIEFYKGLLPADGAAATGAPPLGLSHCAPPARFTRAGFRGFGDE